jgi:5-methylcytosine-specific restriction protein A
VEDDDTIIDIESVTPSEIIDIPFDRPENYTKGISVYKRSHEVVVNALYAANYKCEAVCSTELFTRRHSDKTYTEAHHLIPLCYQANFDKSLDVEANVVSLCPNCHRLLHNGMQTEKLLYRLYCERIKRLETCGIAISFEELLLLYR